MSDKLSNTSVKKTLIKNFSYLSILQISNYVFPVITFPYLVRVLGPEKFGLISFANAFVIYFKIITDYGFNLSATKDISINREDKTKINEIFSTVMLIKIVLMAISFFIMSVLIYSINKFTKDALLYYLAFGSVIGRVLFPLWFFQGLEKMKSIALLNILTKIIFTVFIFLFIQKQNDYLLVPLINSSGFLISGILALLIIIRSYKVKIIFPTLKSIKCHLKESSIIFITSFLSNILASSSVFILGLFETNKIVGYYAAIEKLLKAFLNLFSPITQSLFPYISNKLKISKQYGIKILFKIARYLLILLIIVLVLLNIFSYQIVNIVLSQKYISFYYLINILSPWLLFSILNNFIGIQFLVGAGFSKYYMKSFYFAAAITFILYFILTPLFSYYGVISGMLCGEVTLTIFMTHYIIKKRLAY